MLLYEGIIVCLILKPLWTVSLEILHFFFSSSFARLQINPFNFDLLLIQSFKPFSFFPFISILSLVFNLVIPFSCVQSCN